MVRLCDHSVPLCSMTVSSLIRMLMKSTETSLRLAVLPPGDTEDTFSGCRWCSQLCCLQKSLGDNLLSQRSPTQKNAFYIYLHIKYTHTHTHTHVWSARWLFFQFHLLKVRGQWKMRFINHAQEVWGWQDDKCWQDRDTLCCLLFCEVSLSVCVCLCVCVCVIDTQTVEHMWSAFIPGVSVCD